MLRDPADRMNLKDPDAIIGAQSENDPTATNMLDDLEKRVEAGEAGALAAPNYEIGRASCRERV